MKKQYTLVILVILIELILYNCVIMATTAKYASLAITKVNIKPPRMQGSLAVLPIVILFMQRSGTEAGISTTVLLDQTFIPEILNQFGDFGGHVLNTATNFLSNPQYRGDLDNKAKESIAKILASKSESSIHYEIAKDVQLTATIEARVQRLANAFHALTQHKIVITSGTRTAKSQAAAMYTKLKSGDDLKLYSNHQAVSEVRNAYQDALNNNKGESDIISAITNVITSQMSRGIYISRHLRSGAIDIRKRDMSQANKTIFKNIILSTFGDTAKLIDEGVPPHFHLQFVDIK